MLMTSGVHPIFSSPSGREVRRMNDLFLFLLLLLLLRSHWNIGPQQLSVAEVSIAVNFFTETGLLAPCSNPQPGEYLF
jgi:hypothetical protein